jgi:alpha-L-fucosidase
MKYYAFVHFGPNTFTDVEWGHGDEKPDVFNPTQLDCRQWIRIFKAAGMEGVIITAKHHDGFCLWPSQYSTHTVRESPWKEGNGDVLRELADACREYGLKLGVYLSPWDRNHPDYGSDRYNQTFMNMLGEALTRYGDVFEVWFDGANGEGPNGKKQVYDWKGFVETVRTHQPNAVIFSDAGPDVRWIGNENGFADTTNWCTVNSEAWYPGIPDVNDELQHGHEGGKNWLPAEVNTSIRPGWFYHRAEDERVKPLERLVENYFSSVGMNGNFLLNIPVDPRGIVHENDSARLMELRRYLDEAFGFNLAAGAVASASQVRGAGYEAALTLDGNAATYWAADDETRQAWLGIEFPTSKRVEAVLLREPVSMGQRIKSFVIEANRNGKWEEIARGTTIGNRRIVRTRAMEATGIRIRILESLACPLLSTVEVYDLP